MLNKVSDINDASQPCPEEITDTLKNARLSLRAKQLLTERQGNLPVWIRAPKSGNEFYSGASRAKLYEWAGKGFLRSVSIREPGQVRGTRMFHLQSILSFIERCETEGAARA